jgi:hypothetical protein
MPNSKSIAALIGPTLVAVALAMLFNLSFVPALARQVSEAPALIFISGLLLFVAGLAIVRAHNIWRAGWEVLVTVCGWLALIGGLSRLLFPFQFAGFASGLSESTGAVIAILLVLLALGFVLSIKGWQR